MPQDDDITRVAAALRVPGLRYRSFGNEPVRPETVGQANGAERNAVLNAAARSDLVAPPPAEEPRHTMKLIAEALSPPAPVAGPFAAAAPAWPLLEALAQPPAAAEAHEPACGTLVQLFGGLSIPPVAAPAPLALPPGAFALPATAPAGPFPAAWAPAAAAAPGHPLGLVPADRVTTPLAEVLQGLGRGGSAAGPAFAGLRLPGSAQR